MKLYTPNEKPNTELDTWIYNNWMKIPIDVRKKCINLLLDKIDIDTLNHWIDQHSRNIQIGSDILCFHHGMGMAIRNLFRSVLTDNELPYYQNWDDFYSGALRELCEIKIQDQKFLNALDSI